MSTITENERTDETCNDLADWVRVVVETRSEFAMLRGGNGAPVRAVTAAAWTARETEFTQEQLAALRDLPGRAPDRACDEDDTL